MLWKLWYSVGDPIYGIRLGIRHYAISVFLKRGHISVPKKRTHQHYLVKALHHVFIEICCANLTNFGTIYVYLYQRRNTFFISYIKNINMK